MKRALIPAAVALLAIPATSLAHDATVVCDPAHPGSYVVTPDYTHLNPTWTFTATTVTVVWSDRYRVTLPLPPGCVAPPPVVPPVVPPNPTWTPAPESKPEAPVVGPLPVVTPVEPMPRKRVTPRKPVKVTCKLLNARRAGIREYTKRGWYYRCKAPKPPRKYLARVPVTG